MTAKARVVNEINYNRIPVTHICIEINYRRIRVARVFKTAKPPLISTRLLNEIKHR